MCVLGADRQEVTISVSDLEEVGMVSVPSESYQANLKNTGGDVLAALVRTVLPETQRPPLPDYGPNTPHRNHSQIRNGRHGRTRGRR
jgi:hypothetical protein